MGWNPLKEAEKKAKQAVDKVIKPAVRLGERAIEKATDAADEAIWKARRAAWAAVMSAKEQAVDKVEDAAREAEDGLTEKLPGMVEEAVTEKLPEMVEDAAQKLAKEAAKGAIKEALDNAADVIEMMAPTRFTLIFGIELALVVQGEVCVSVTIPNPIAKLTEVRKWAANPPRGRAQIIDCIRDFAPESLGVEAKVSGNGIAAEWDGDDKFDRVDAFLATHGVD